MPETKILVQDIKDNDQTAGHYLEAPGGWTPPAGGGGGGGHDIQDEGVDLPGQPRLNFVGPSVVASDDAANSATLVTIDAGASGDGWIDDSGETWTYASATTFTVVGDVTAKYTPGTRLKFTQTTVKYFVIVSSSFAGGNTTVTITGGTSYTMVNAAITAKYHSYMANPQGYPDWFNYAPTVTGYTGTPTVSARFSVVGRICTTLISISGTSNATSLTVTVPIPAANLAPFWIGVVRDNGNYQTAPGRFSFSSSTVLQFDKTLSVANGWTASGTKAIQPPLFQYEI